MKNNKNQKFKLLFTDNVKIFHPDHCKDVYLSFIDDDSGTEYKICINIDNFVDSFKKSYLDEVLNNYTNQLKFNLNEL